LTMSSTGTNSRLRSVISRTRSRACWWPCVRPASREGQARRSGSPPAHQPMVKAEEVKPPAAFGQVHNAGLGRLGLQAKLGQQCGQPRYRGLGLLPGGAQHQRVVGGAHPHPVLACPPCPVQPVQVDSAEHGREHSALRSASHAASQRPVLHHPGAQQRAHQAEHARSPTRSSIAGSNPECGIASKQLAMSVSTTSGDPARTHRRAPAR
jgi:hypothetical protein